MFGCLCTDSLREHKTMSTNILYSFLNESRFVLIIVFILSIGKFACKIMIQGFSYAFPVNLTVPVTMSVLIVACGLRHDDPCFFHNSIPDYLFFDSPDVNFLNNFITKEVILFME